MSPRVLWISSGIGFVLAVIMALAARGLASDEEVGHFLIARHAPAHPEQFLNTYGRPLATILYSLPAQAGLWAARFAAAILAGLTTLAVLRILKPTRWRPVAFAVPALFLQPYYLAHCATVMTEPVAACLVAWGILALLERRFATLALILGLLPVARQEFLVFWPLIAWVLFRERRWLQIGLIPVPMALWAGVGALVYGDALWIIRQVGWREYDAREVLHYVKSLAWILGLGLFVPVMIGLARSVHVWIGTRLRNLDPEPGQAPLVISAGIMVIMIPVYTYFAVWHPITFGMHRFFATLAAPIAILAVGGVDWFAEGRQRTVWVALGATLVAGVLLWNHPVHSDMTILVRPYWFVAGVTGGWIVLYLLPRPFRRISPILATILGVFFLASEHGETLHWKPLDEHAGVERAAAALDHMLEEDPIILKDSPLLPYFLEMDPNQESRFPEPSTANLENATPGTWLFWETHYLAGRGKPYAVKALVEDPTWDFRGGFVSRDSIAAVAIFRKSASADSVRTPETEEFLSAATRIQAGLPRFERKLAGDPGNARMARALTLRYFKLGLYQDARRTLDIARRAELDNVENDLLIFSILHDTGQRDRALEIARRVLAREPDNGEMHYLLGRSYIDTNQLKLARKHLLEAARLLPEKEDAQFVAGSILLQAQEWVQAERYLEAARSMNPERRETLLYLGESYRRQGKLTESEVVLEELLERYPNSPGAYRMIAEVLVRAGKTGEAREVLSRGYGITRDPAIKTIMDRMEAETR